MRQIIRDLPLGGFLLMTGIPLVMTGAALVFGWYARQGAIRRRAADLTPTRLVEDAFEAAATVAIVPFSFAVLLIWERFS